MTELPTIDQFPTFANALSWLKKGFCKCIWYLPDKERYCRFGITVEANESALHLAESISKASTLTKGVLHVLANIAEQSCCTRHHSNKIWGSGLAEELAVRWLDEIQAIPSAANRKRAPTVKRETVSPPISPISRCSGELGGRSIDVVVADAQIGIAGHSDPKSSLPDQAVLTTHAGIHAKPVAFAKHQVRKGETLVSKLLGSIGREASKIGSLYIFTYKNSAFAGMVKIGFTNKTIHSRLSEWAECGHGNLDLLDSYDRVRHPARVELLTHFELLDYWYALRWCGLHRQPHIEWFRINIEAASTTIRLWSLWMERANPYDRRGHLKAFWKETVQFLTLHEVPITAEVMMQVQEIEEGSAELRDFIDDEALRKPQTPVVKQERFGGSQAVVGLSQCTKTGHAGGGGVEAKVQAVNIKVEELRTSSETAMMAASESLL